MKEWLTIAQNLPVGHNKRIDCPSCGVGTNTYAAIVNHNPKYYSCYCNACGPVDYEPKGELSLAERKHIQELNEAAANMPSKEIKLPEDTTYEHTEFSREARMWLYKAGLTPSLWRKYNIGYSKRLGRVVLPVTDDKGTLVWYQLRAVYTGQKPKYMQPSAPRDHVLFKGQGTRDKAVVVEDVMSAIRTHEAQSTYTAISLLGTKITSSQSNVLSQFQEVVTWLDGDKAGIVGARNVRKVVGLLTECRNIRTAEDPKCYSNKEIRSILDVRTPTSEAV